MSSPFIETFPALSEIDGLKHGFILRNPEIDVKTDRDTAISRLQSHYHERLNEMGIPLTSLASGEQVHGDNVQVLSSADLPAELNFPETDGLITDVAGQYLGIYVADCGAVYLVDPVKKACGAVHSGKNGSALGIAAKAAGMMSEFFGSNPEDLIVQVGPCIRPPQYEIDFAAQIVKDCIEAGIPADQVHDCGTCTTSDLDRYYSYRVEKGKTGRLFAVIGWEC